MDNKFKVGDTVIMFTDKETLRTRLLSTLDTNKMVGKTFSVIGAHYCGNHKITECKLDNSDQWWVAEADLCYADPNTVMFEEWKHGT